MSGAESEAGVAAASAAVAAVDPAGGEAGRLGGADVVEEALGHVEDLPRRDAVFRQQRRGAREMGRRRLVAAHVVGGDDGMERLPQTPGTVGEGRAVDVRQHHQHRPLPKGRQRRHGIREGRPVGDRRGEGAGVFGRGRDSEITGDGREGAAQHVGIGERRTQRFQAVFVAGEGGEQRVVLRRQPARAQGPENAALPVDERAVAVEGEGAGGVGLHLFTPVERSPDAPRGRRASAPASPAARRRSPPPCDL